MKKQRVKSFSFEPNVPFRSGTITARCRKVWLTLFEHLYEAGQGAETFDLVLWEIQDDGAVRMTPRSSGVLETTRSKKIVEAVFRVDGVKQEIGRAKTTAQRDKVCAELHQWLYRAIVEAFESEAVEVEYSYFNEQDEPFSVVATDRDVGLQSSQLKLLLSDFGGPSEADVARKQQCLEAGREFRPRKRASKRVVKVKRQPAAKKPEKRALKTFGPGWQRFYFDDGKTRRFWYVHTRGSVQTVVQGTIGTSGSVRKKTLSSAKAAREHAKTLCEQKLRSGFIAYDPEAIRYGRKNRRAMKLLRKALAEYENTNAEISAEFRRYILEVNGGSPEPDWITLPEHPDYKKVQVGRILGFKPGQMVDEIDYYAEMSALPSGHVPLASGRHLFTVDSLGAVHFWDDRQLEPGDVADDNTVHYDRVESFVVAHSLDEFLTRIARFPQDTAVAVEHKSPEQQRKATAKRAAQVEAEYATKPFRRFFFDDGDLRKYWYIDLQGKSHTTYYARYGSRPGETKKTFDSDEAAARSAAKLIQQKLKKGYHEIIPEKLSITRPSDQKPATEAAIRKLEKKLGTELPDEYRQFLTSQNGGEPEPGFVQIPGIPSIANVDIAFIYGLYPDNRPGESLASGIEVSGAVLPRGHLPIAHGGDIFSLALERHRGSVYFWNHESDDIYENSGKFRYSAGHLLAHSFDEFLTRIAMFESSA